MTIKQALIKSIQQLQKAGIPSPHLDGEILLARALNKSKEFLYAHSEYQLSQKETDHFTGILHRRLNREPTAYIINKKEFYGYDFYVDKRVLIPRPETETIVDQVLTAVESIKNLKLRIKNSNLKFKIIDIGTGSGCIIISLVKELLKFSTRPMVEASSQIQFYATDISADALAVAKLNAKKHKVEKYITFLQGDLLEPIIKFTPKLFTFRSSLFTFITANLPYITPKKYLTLGPEIKKYEPKLALLTPQNNADYYYKKLDQQIAELKKMTKAKIWKFYEKPQNLSILR